jgi:hypothetical protein
MENFSNGSGTVFWRFFVGGIVTIGGFIVPAQIGTTNFWLELWIKLFTTGIGAAMSGFIAVLIADFYKYKVKHKLFKNKTNGKRNKNKAA